MNGQRHPIFTYGDAVVVSHKLAQLARDYQPPNVLVVCGRGRDMSTGEPYYKLFLRDDPQSAPLYLPEGFLYRAPPAGPMRLEELPPRDVEEAWTRFKSRWLPQLPLR